MKHVAVSKPGHRTGEAHPNAKYTDGEVEEVRRLRVAGWGYKRITRATKMPMRTVRSILNGTRRAATVTALEVGNG